MESVKRYIILEQERIAITMFERVNAEWVGRLYSRGMILNMPEIGICVPIEEFYEDIEFPDL